MTEIDATPLLSVVSITLNDKEGLTRTIRSLAAQTGQVDFEHIIVDGNSNYEISDVLRSLQWVGFLHIQKSGCGIYDAMNIGVEKAKGEYILFLNGGDVLADDAVLNCTAKVLLAEKPDFLYGNSLERQLDGTVLEKRARAFTRLPFGMISHHQAMFFRRDILLKNGIRYNTQFKIAADYDFVLRYVRASDQVSYLPKAICVFDRGGASYQKRSLGRREQFSIRRSAYGSTAFALVVFAGQWLLRSIRQIFPSGYWFIHRRLG